MNQGFAAIITIFVLGLTAILIAMSLAFTGYQESIMGRARNESSVAFYAAQSGVEEAISRLQNQPDFGFPGPNQFSLDVGEASVTVTVSGSEDSRTIRAVGTYDRYVRQLRVEINNTSIRPGFLNAVHTGQGGFEMEHQTKITGIGGALGNVYSNASIKGDKNDYFSNSGECKTASSHVTGSVWAVGAVDKLSTNGTGICVDGSITAGQLNYCYAKGELTSPTAPSNDCKSNIDVWNQDDGPEALPLPEMGIDSLKAYLTGRGNIFTGNCIVDDSNPANDCTRPSGTLGNIIINGNLHKPSNKNLTIDGPVWVTGNITFASQGVVNIHSDITEISQLVIADGTINTSSNVSYASNGSAFLLFVSLKQEPFAQLCQDPAITLSSNTDSVLFYAPNGCIKIVSNSTFRGAVLGEKIYLSNNSDIYYNPLLANAIFGLTTTGGWQIASFNQE
jgi:hypothetical protein